MPDTPKNEGFLNRWSRVKTEGEQKPEPQASTPAKPVEEELTDAELLEKLGLPDPLTLKEGDDVSGFMASQVPEHLRRIALRFLWRSNPVLANVDGLVDYGEDFTDAATVMENMQTIYQVGKGAAWKFKEEQEALAAVEAETDAETETEDTLQRTTESTGSDDTETAEGDVMTPNTEIEDIQVVEEAHVTSPEPTDVTAPRPRPMQFEFD